MGPEGGRLDRPTQAVRQTCSGNLGIVKILCYIRSDMCTASATNSKLLYIARKIGPPGHQGPVLEHNGKSGTDFSIFLQAKFFN